MPWDVSKVDEHKGGLSDKQKRQWVHIANSVLKRCMDEGGEESTCAISAIKQANGSVKTNEMETYTLTAIDYQIKSRIYQGRKHIIVPVVMMVEGVHNGSHGPLLHQAEDLGKYPASWDGIPVMIGHPSVEGFQVSANMPDVMEQAVGRVFNTYMDDKKLKAEVWLDEQKLMAISPTALSYIQNGRHLEVSVGVFSDEEQTSGNYINTNGEEEQYVAIARNHRPDHLALLPGESGACGWNDGCGIRANSSSETIKLNEDGNMNEDVILTMRQLAHENLLFSITDNRQGYQELIQKISEKLYANDSEDEYYMLEEVYNDSVVYRKRCKTNEEGSGFYQQAYQINEDNSVELVEEPKRVRRDVRYVQLNALKRTKFNINKEEGETKMTENDKPCCLEKVVELLGNKLINLTEADREWLLELGPEKLEKITPKIPEVIEAPQVNMTEYVQKSSLKTAEDVLEIVPEEMKESFQSGLKLHQEFRANLVKAILDNSEPNVWTEDELNEQNTAMLEKLNKQFKPRVDYSAQAAGAPAPQVNQGEEILLPLGIQ